MKANDQKKIEILSPAGDMERLEMAMAYGADAVYLAGRQFGMRAAAGNFDADEMIAAVDMAHAAGASVYVTCNNVVHNREAALLPAFLESLEAAKADAVIVTDLGVLALAKRHAPHLAVHISTQAGVANYEAARAFYDMGAARVILARELTLEEIAELRAKTPEALEIEAFVHGSMCVSFSGRCLLSNYLTGRDANHGACAQPCRWKYHLLEEQHPGEYFEITEDGGTYLLNSRDLCMIDHIPELMAAGVTSAKIEGRMKSAYYAAVVTNAYRHAADAAAQNSPLDPVWRDEVNKVSHRDYSTGFFFAGGGPGQFYENALYFTDCDVMARVETCNADGNALLTQRNKFYLGDRLTLLTPNDKPIEFTVEAMTDGEGNPIESTPHPMMPIRMKLPVPAPRLSMLRKERNQ